MAIHIALKSGLILLALVAPSFAQQPTQRVPPWKRQAAQQPAGQQQQAPATQPGVQPPQPNVYAQPNASAPAAQTARPQANAAAGTAQVSPAAGTTASPVRPGNAAGGVAATTAPPTPAAGQKQNGKKSARKSAKKEEPPEPLPPPSPIAQMTPADLPPSPPQVSFLNGQLLVLSQNATLSDVLSAIRSRTGAQIEYPASAAQERVAIRLGPAAPRDVLTQLLSGSKFDYVILGTPQQPGAVQRVILTLRQGGAAGTQVASNPVQRTPSPAPPVQEEVNPDEDQSDFAAAGPEQEPQVTQPSPQGIQPPGGAANAQPNQAFPNPPFQNPPFQQQPQVQMNGGAVQQPGQGQVKTPEQLLRELQQMQQQQQQQQQNQNQNPPPED